MPKDRWDEPEFAQQWDHNQANQMTRAEQLDILISLIKDIYQPGTAILDLGIGSGLIEAQLFAQRPDAHVVGVDSSTAMLALARQRLASFAGQIEFVEHDFVAVQDLHLPTHRYQLAISAQALHHLSHQEQQEIYRFTARTLGEQGVFLLMDRIALDAEHFAPLYRSMWERLERMRTVGSRLSGDKFLQGMQDKEDYPSSVEQQLTWLRAAGFHATCLHVYLDRALVAAVKTGDPR